MENKKKISVGMMIGIIVLTIASFVCTFAEVYLSFVYYLTPMTLLELLTFLALFILIVYYAIYGYKKPHGDLLRYLFGLFSANCLAIILSEVECVYDYGFSVNYLVGYVGIVGVAAVLSAFISGRLDKIRKNIVPIVIVTIIFIIKVLFYFSESELEYGLIEVIWDFSTCILWIDIVVAYIVRYKQHKEAGLIDKN